MPANNKINIAIDGHSSCGKGTLARFLANHLGYLFVDTGSMYRAVTLYLLQNGVDINNAQLVEDALPQIHIGFQWNEHNRRNDAVLNGENVESLIRNMDVAGRVSDVAKIPAVRRYLVGLQRALGKDKGVVMDGRDIGTVVFPDAELKIFMTASAEVRAKRRFAELTAAGVKTTYEDVWQNLVERDRIDSSREDSPLHLTHEYHVLDNSDLSIAQQNEIALSWINEILDQRPMS